MMITVVRTNKSADGSFGNLSVDTSPFKCVTLENSFTLIPAGVVYRVLFMWSNHFQQLMPHVLVPGRTAVEIHWANYVIDPTTKREELDGCTALGKEEDFKNDMITESKDTWIAFAKELTDQPSIYIKYLEDYGN